MSRGIEARSATVVIRLKDGRTISGTRRYRTCTPKRASRRRHGP